MVTSVVYFEMQNNLICTRNHFETKILKIRDIKYRYKDFPEIGVLWSISETLYIGKHRGHTCCSAFRLMSLFL